MQDFPEIPEGKIAVTKEYPGSERYLVTSDSETGSMKFVGYVWAELSWSLRRTERLWWGRVAGSRIDAPYIGPFLTRKAAASAVANV